MARDELANGTVAPGQEGVPELNVGRALAALQRWAEAQPYFDQALELAHDGPPERAALLFSAQNLLSLGRGDEAAATARRFRDMCQKKGLALYLEGAALRRSGHPNEAVALLEQVGEAANEDGFSFAANLLLVELAGALVEAGRAGEATDHLVRLVSISPSPGYVAAAMQVFAASDRAVRDLALAMPGQHLDKVAAALLIVPPVMAEPMADALYTRFGPKPELLAAATRFAPLVGTARALEWSARLRGIGMAGSCPLLAQARMAVLAVPERVLAAVTAFAAFGDTLAAQLALALAPGVHETDIAAVLAQAAALCPPLLAEFALSAAGPGADGGGPVGTPAQRSAAVSAALADLGYHELAAQIGNAAAAQQPDLGPAPQLVAAAADH
jgi:tetratricopeptide (TPR) repeat protein